MHVKFLYVTTKIIEGIFLYIRKKEENESDYNNP